MLRDYSLFNGSLSSIQGEKVLITTLNAHSYNVACNDSSFAKALQNSDVLIPDGAGIVKAIKWLRGENIERIANWDLFEFEMKRLVKRTKNQEQRQEEELRKKFKVYSR